MIGLCSREPTVEPLRFIAFLRLHLADAAAGTDSSDSTEHQHEHNPANLPRVNFPAHSALGRFAYFITSVTPGGCHVLA
jgi:hypothetical protein